MNTVLKVSNIEKRYKNFRMDNISFDIEQGSIVGVIGENGAGKTTLISLILSQKKPDGGSIQIFNQNTLKMNSDLKQEIGFYIDECCFHPCFSASDISTILGSIYKKWDNKQYMSYISMFKVPKNKKISDMSKGTKNKLMLAASLSYHASILVFDEITSGLDPIIRNQILQVIREYVSAHNATVLFSTHITSDLENIADKILFLHQGRQVFYKNTDELKKKYGIYQCGLEEYAYLPKKGVIRVLTFGKQFTVLIDKSGADREVIAKCDIPSIEDFMHLYIEGEVGV